MKICEILSIGGCIFFFFGASLGNSYFSSNFLSVHGYNFEFPLFYFAVHQFIHFAMASFGIWYLKKDILHEQAIESPLPYIMREKIGSPVSSSTALSLHKKDIERASTSHAQLTLNTTLSTAYQFLRDIGTFNIWIAVCCFIGSIDAGFSGHALTRISLPFYTMLKASTPIFILFARFIFQLEKPSFALVGIISMIAFGISLAAKSETVEFDIKHGAMIIGACIMAGFRWGFLEYFIKQSTHKNNSTFHSLCVLSLLSSIFMFVGFLLFEGPASFLAYDKFHTASGLFLCSFLILLTGVIGFFGVLAEFIVISKTNVMVSSVILIIKEIAILCISVKRKVLVLSHLNIFGLCVSILGISLFTFRSIILPSEELPEPKSKTEEIIQPADEPEKIYTLESTADSSPVITTT